MRVERTSRTGLYVPAVPPPAAASALKESSILRALRAPFESLQQAEADGDGLALLETKQVEIVARFGHVAWPLYRSQAPPPNAVAGGAAQQGFGPAFAGQRSFDRVAEWVAHATDKVKSIFLAS